MEKQTDYLEIQRQEAEKRAIDQINEFRDLLMDLELPEDGESRQALLGVLFNAFEALAVDLFPTELAHFDPKIVLDLTTSAEITVTPKPVATIYKEAALEKKRTLYSLFSALFLIPKSESDIVVKKDSPLYHLFTVGQNKAVSEGKTRLTLDSFNELRSNMFKACPTDVDTLTLLSTLASHDITKLDTVANIVSAKAKVSSINHDYLLTILTADQQLIDQLTPSLMRLPQNKRELAIQIATSNFNRAQTTQGESTPAHLLYILSDYVSESSVWMRIAESSCDLSGVTGDGIGKAYTEDVYYFYKATDKIMAALKRGEYTPKGAYAALLQVRSDYLKAGINLAEEDFDTEKGKEKIALMRFACLFRVSSHEQFTKLEQEFNRLGKTVRASICEIMSRSGLDGKASVLFYYGPNLMCSILATEKKEDPENGDLYGYSRGMRLMSRLCKAAKSYMEKNNVNQPILYDIKNQRWITFEEVKELRGGNIGPDGVIREMVFGVSGVNNMLDSETISIDPVSIHEHSITLKYKQ